MYITKEEIHSQILEKLKGKWTSKGSFLAFADNKFYAPSYNEFKDFIEEHRAVISPINDLEGTEGYDCDDYAFALKGQVCIYNRNKSKQQHSWAVGIVWADFKWLKGFHAANWVLTSDKGLHLFEPQLSSKGFYPFTSCLGNVQLVLL